MIIKGLPTPIAYIYQFLTEVAVFAGTVYLIIKNEYQINFNLNE